MGRVMNTSEYRISPNEVLHITNILRSLGLNTSFIGTKLINKSIQYIIKNDLSLLLLKKFIHICIVNMVLISIL